MWINKGKMHGGRKLSFIISGVIWRVTSIFLEKRGLTFKAHHKGKEHVECLGDDED